MCIGARDEVRRRAAADQIGVHLLVMDVTDDAALAAAAGLLTAHENKLDVLIKNAGVFDAMVKAEDATAEGMRAVYDVHVFRIVRTTHAFLPMLQASNDPAIINVASGLGSFGIVPTPSVSRRRGRCRSTYPPRLPSQC